MAVLFSRIVSAAVPVTAGGSSTSSISMVTPIVSSIAVLAVPSLALPSWTATVTDRLDVRSRLSATFVCSCPVAGSMSKLAAPPVSE